MKSEIGNGWEMYHGDCFELAELVGDVDHIISDPPFTDHVSNNQRRQNGGGLVGDINHDALSFGGVNPAELVDAFLPLVRRWCLFWCAMEQIGAYQLAAGDAYKRGGVWIKSNPTPQFTGDRPAMWGESVAILHGEEKLRWNGRPTTGEAHTSNRSASGRGMPAIWRGSTEHADRHHETQKPL